MVSFQVSDMRCGHCVDVITKALQSVDAAAKLRFDLAAHRVHVETVEADATALGAALELAGYSAFRIDAAEGSAAAPARKGCCCG
jgi:copper chaperone